MWYFEAMFFNLDRGEDVRVTVEVDTMGVDVTEEEVWCMAVRKALEHPMPLIFNGIEFRSC